jgi:poly(3-hydroxybutyrate) depolymerase
MLYDAYELQQSWLSGASIAAGIGKEWLQSPANPLAYTGMAPLFASGLDVFEHASARRGKPAFGLDHTTVAGEEVAVREEILLRKPFGQLKHFVREGVEGGPKLLIVAPMSGHFATLLRGTVERMLPDHDVYITDWRDAKQVPTDCGDFTLDDYIDYLIAFLEKIGPGAHMLAVCQPAVPAYAAAALMSEDKNPARPRSLSMMGGPIDTRKAPTVVNTVATQRPLAWFRQNVIQTVPYYYAGHGRKVYPGFLQLSGFMAMNLGNHLMSHYRMFQHLVDGDGEGATGSKAFYEEYRSVADMTAEFYLQTIDDVFQQHKLPKGELVYRGRKVDPRAITDVALFAIEGERDDISGIGQTKAALTIATGLPKERKKYLLAKSVGHYGIFNGRRWREEIAPVLERFIAEHDAG